jgi:ankyrin repeat protein
MSDVTTPLLLADPIRRRAETTQGTAKTGRGSQTGWTVCPLCPSKQKQPKRYALGRGIATHLHAIHTPWQPPRRKSKGSNKKKVVDDTKHRDKRQRVEEKDAVKITEPLETIPEAPSLSSWNPTSAEIAEWNALVLQIVADLERNADATDDVLRHPGFDRTGQVATTYPQSLSPFMQAAAQGDLPQLQSLIESAGANVAELLYARDRHGSMAEHWAAGGGHVDCLRYLRQCRAQHPTASNEKRGRRRDGKTALHYAARHGQLACVQYLLQDEEGDGVDVRSNDGTTPLHLACYGGHGPTIRHLIETGGADMAATNDWGCHGLHWIGMTLNQSEIEITELLQYWMERQGRAAFFVRQKHGHTIVHKAAQKLNQAVIEFMGKYFTEKEERAALGGPDANGHAPSQIWQSFGGSAAFAQRMEQEWQW